MNNIRIRSLGVERPPPSTLLQPHRAAMLAQAQPPPLRAKLTQALQSQKHDFNYLEPDRFLELRSTEVVVAFAEDPNDFYVQICEPTTKRKFREMSALLNAELAGPQSEHGGFMPLMVGSPVAAPYGDSWCRGRILSVPDSAGAQQVYSIQFVDFGNTETLPLHQMKPLDAKFLQLPPVAVHCSLKDARPLQSSWPVDARVFMESLLDKTPELLCIFYKFDRVRMAFEVDLVIHQAQPLGPVVDYLIKNGWAEPVSNWAHQQRALTTASAAVPVTPPIPVARAESVRPIFPRRKQFISGHQEALVQVSYATSPVDFYLHVVSIRDELVNVVFACGEHYIGTTTPEHLPGPVVRGQGCVARFAEDGGWYRAETLQDRGAEGISVYFVDFGNVAVCTREDVRYVADDAILLKTPALAVHCRINGLSDSNVSITNFDENGRNEFESLVDGNVCIFLGLAEDGSYDVLILTKSDVDLVDAYLKKTPSAAAADEVSNAVEEQPPPKKARNAPGGVEVPGLPPLDLDVDSDSFIDCRVVLVDEDGSLSVNARNASPLMEELQLLMNSQYREAGDGDVLVNPKKLQLGVLRPEGQEGWRRVLVMERTNAKELAVYCVDVGQTLVVQKDRVLELRPELSVIPPQAIRCRLEGVENPQSKLDEIRRLILNKNVVLQIQGGDGDEFLVKMHLDSRSGGASINDLLMDSRRPGGHLSAVHGAHSQPTRNPVERAASSARPRGRKGSRAHN